MLRNISADRIIVRWGGQTYEMPYGNLEEHLSVFLYRTDIVTYLIENKKLYVINGPGSFTNLRIATLAISTWNMLHDFCCDVYSCDKITLLRSLYNQQRIPHQGVVYIGQKKNVWWVDLQANNMDCGEQDAVLYRLMSLEHIREKIMLSGNNIFIDEVVAEGRDMVLGAIGDQLSVPLDFSSSISYDDVRGDPQKMITPHYMIQANISSSPSSF